MMKKRMDCGMDYLRISKRVEIEWMTEPSISMQKAGERFLRDLAFTVAGEENAVRIVCTVDCEMPEEAWHIHVDSGRSFSENAGIFITGADELALVYAFLYLSREYLGIMPFWFWNDQEFVKREFVLIPEGEYYSKLCRVRFRGWFVNDEVLIDGWKADKDNEYVWEMVFEALLRLGGNMVIPGTDHNSRKNRKLASDMGLWITHHHAEPLGAEMFARAYPKLVPSYAEYPEQFHELWKKGIAEQLDYKVIWNLGFRGQGDRPFWLDDPQYDTPQKRGKLMSDLIHMQYEEVKKQVKHPICCTNLYGEIMELYQQGYLTFPEDVIYIWADNGYGKMVSRRQGNENPRISALPEIGDGKKHGIYYHASFYDLQAAGHITMLPNSPQFVAGELKKVLEHGADEFWIVNSSNVKPHTYMLDLIASCWRNGVQADFRSHTAEKLLEEEKEEQQERGISYEARVSGQMTKAYVTDYFSEHRKEIWECYQLYHRYMLHYGKHEDERAGDQFYSYMVRSLAHGWMMQDIMKTEKSAVWATGVRTLREQVEWFQKCIWSGMDGLKLFCQTCEKLEEKLEGHDRELFADSILLQANIHWNCAKGSELFCEGFDYFLHEYYEQAFFKVKMAAEWFLKADQSMREREHGKWKDFYKNDCLTDIKFTAYCLEGIAHMIRSLGDGPHFYGWARTYLKEEKDRGVMLITNTENHVTDQELYQAMKKRTENRKNFL